jgi:hypothetical protein
LEFFVYFSNQFMCPVRRLVCDELIVPQTDGPDCAEDGIDAGQPKRHQVVLHHGQRVRVLENFKILFNKNVM